MFTNTPSDRVQVVGRGDLLHPGSCALCGSGNCDEGYVNTGIYYDYEGQVYFCIDCTRQIAEVIGCLLPEEANVLREQANEIMAVNKKLNELLEAANERLRAFDVAFASVKFPDDPSASVAETVTEISDSSNPVVKASDTGKSEVKKSTPVKRRNHIKQPELRNTPDGGDRFDL